MLTSLGLIFLLGLLMAAVCQRIHLPRIIGMLLTGIILGPYVLDLLDVSILNISSELRQIALIIILLKAGLSLDLKDLKKVGRSAVMLACVPATCELLAFVIFAPMILNISRVDAAVMGAVLAAVSPAVVVPRMVHLMENSYGTEKSIPQMILAGASCDDIYVIVLFSTFVGMAQGGQVNALDFVNIPVSILTGVLFGALVGWLLGQLFELLYRKGSYVRNSMKVIIIMGLSFLLMALETLLKGIVAFSGLLAVVSMACALKIRASREVTGRLSAKFGKLWLAAEVVLFVLVGAAVDIRYTMQAGIAAVAMILLALVFRAVQINHQAVNVDLIGRFCAEHGIGDFARNVFHGLENAFAAETSRILVAEFNRFAHAGRSARGNRRRCDNAAFKPNFRFNGRIAAAVENLTADDIDNGAHVCASQIYLRVEMMVCLTALFSPSGLG